MKLGAYVKGSAAFVKTLVRPHVRETGRSENGHSLLEGWESSPEEAVIARTQALASRAVPTARLALYCYEGPHAGETHFLSKSLETISRHAGASLVLTPADLKLTDSYRVFINGVVTLMGEGGCPFLLNGCLETKGELLDYDELELLGNKFLVLTLNETNDGEHA